MLAKAQSLFQHFTQSRRLLRLHTPLGSDVLLAECVRGEEALGENYAFTISALSEDAGLSLRRLLGQPALLELETTSSGPRYFHGHLTSVDINGANGGMARYTLVLQPWCAFLENGRDSRIFQDKNVFDPRRRLSCLARPGNPGAGMALRYRGQEHLFGSQPEPMLIRAFN